MAPSLSEVPPAAARRIVALSFLCLDAPLVAVTWQGLFGRTLAVEIDGATRAALFLTAWLIYLTERFVDTCSLDSERKKSGRQEFCFDHRGAWLAAMATVGVADTWLICGRLDSQTIWGGLIVGAFAIFYLTLNWSGKLWALLPVKEVTVGTLFAAGTVLVPIGRGAGLRIESFGAAAAFAAVCSLNCISIAVWERALDRAQQKMSIATRLPQLVRHLRALAHGLAAIAMTFAFLHPKLGVLFGCVAVSSWLLGRIDASRNGLSRDKRTALADLVLLTPLFPLLFALR